MSVTTLFLLFPFALLTTSILCYLFFSAHDLLSVIPIKVLRIVSKAILYFIVTLLLTYALTLIGFMLFFGIVGLPVLIILDIISVVLLVRKKKKNKANKQSEVNNI